MNKRFFPFSLAVFMACLLTMTSCSAAELTGSGRGMGMESAEIEPETQSKVLFSDVPADAEYSEVVAWCNENILENTELYDFALTDKEMTQINALDRNEKHDWY